MIPRFHVVTDDGILDRPEFPEAAAAVLAEAARGTGSAGGGAGVAFHLRGPRCGGARLFRLASLLLPRAREAGVTFLVNDRVDVALVAGADGVHLGTRSLPPTEARRLLPAGSCVGASVHGPREAAALGDPGPDFLLVGAIHATPSHPGETPGGVERLRQVAAVAGGIPLLAIGGMTPDRVAEARAAGAHGVAVLGGVWHREDPAAAIRSFLEVVG